MLSTHGRIGGLDSMSVIAGTVPGAWCVHFLSATHLQVNRASAFCHCTNCTLTPKNDNGYPSESALYGLLLHWFRHVFHTPLLAPRRYVRLFPSSWRGLRITMYRTAWNIGICLSMIWTGLGCLIQCINSIVWNNNMVDKAPIYCDIGNPLTRPVVP